MKNTRRYAALVMLAALCVTAVSAAGNEIKIAVAGPMTGSFAEYGNGFKNAVQLMVDEWNAKGGVLGRKIKAVVYDDKNNGEEGANVAEKIIADDDIIGVIGHFASGVCLVAGPKYQEAGVIEISPSASHPDYSNIGDFIFRNNTTIDVEAGAGVDIAMKILKAKKIGILSVKTDWGTSTAAITKNLIAARGGKVYAHEEVIDGTVDLSPSITKMQTAGVDCVIVAAMYNVLAPFATQYKAINPNIKLVGFSNAYTEQLIALAKENAEGIMFPAAFFDKSTEPNVQKFVKEYRAKYNATPSALTAQAYDSAGILLEAIKAAGKADRKAVRDQLFKINYQGVTGPTSFDSKGNAVKVFTSVVIKNGEFVEYK